MALGNDQEFVAALKSRLHAVQTEVARLRELEKEMSSLTALIAHHERQARNAFFLPNQVSTHEDYQAAIGNFPSLVGAAARALLKTDLGPEASISELFNALPQTFRLNYSGTDERSHMETFRSQVRAWKDHYGLSYVRGRVALAEPGKFDDRIMPGNLVLRTGTYHCRKHEQVRNFQQDEAARDCSLGDGDCEFVWAGPIGGLMAPSLPSFTDITKPA